ncbi:MAG TPA: glycosyltransferase family 1 protein [Chloroflexi bacterium]|nr:glycosyltransferase family 1 protein [Chloroflexota bacterium]
MCTIGAMRIVIVTIGTRGDVQPYVALAQGLRRAGHAVVICTHPTFREFIESHAINFAPLAGDIHKLLTSDAGRRLLAQHNPLAAIRQLQAIAAPLLCQVMADIITATAGADLILGSTLGYLNAVTAAQVHGVPLVLAGLQPFTPTAAFPSPLLAPSRHHWPGVGVYNRLTHHASYRLLQLVSARLANRCHRELTGRAPLRYTDVFGELIAQRRPVIYGISEQLLPRPADYSAQIRFTGFWFLDRTPGWQPPPALADFLAAGAAPVYIGFGSMSDRNPAQLAQIAVAALQRSGQRGILATGWEGVQASDLPANILRIDAAPHDWLFPQVAAVVHHGGVGTTAAALRAGAPQIVIPFSADQPLWAEMVSRRGVGTRPIPRRRLTATRLSAAISEAVHNPSLRIRTRQAAATVCQEDGVGEAVMLVNTGFAGCISFPGRIAFDSNQG